MSGLNKSSLKSILILAMSLPILSFNLWVYLFKDWLLANTFYLITIWLIPIIFYRIFDVKLELITKDWQSFKAFEPLENKKGNLAFWIFLLFCIVGTIFSFFMLRKYTYNITLHVLFPLFDHKYLEIIYAILTFFMTVLIMPCLEADYYFEIGYNSIDNTFLAKLLTGFLFMIKYCLFIVYLLKGNHFSYFILSLVKLFVLFFWISYIYGGEFKKETKIALSVLYLLMFANFIMLHYKDHLKLLSPIVDWNNSDNFFNRIRDWRDGN